jgi:hypothetical protein
VKTFIVTVIVFGAISTAAADSGPTVSVTGGRVQGRCSTKVELYSKAYHTRGLQWVICGGGNRCQ